MRINFSIEAIEVEGEGPLMFTMVVTLRMPR